MSDNRYLWWAVIPLAIWAFHLPSAEDFTAAVRYSVYQDGIPITGSDGVPFLYATEVEAGMALQKAANENPQSQFSVRPEGQWVLAPQESGEPYTPTTATPPPLEDRLVWDYACTSDNAPQVPKRLDGAVVTSSYICVEVLLSFKPHHVIFKSNGATQRRENYYPYTSGYEYNPGQTVVEAVVYSTEDSIQEVIEATFVIDLTANTSPDPAPLISVTFEWTAPDSREDGTPLRPDEIANFALLWAGSRVLLDGTARTTTRVFPPGDYTFAMTAIDLDGRESVPSEPERVSL